MILEMLAGPTVASILLTGVAYGRAGYSELIIRLARWRVGWYAASLLIAPLVLIAVPFALSMGFPEFTPRIFTDGAKRSLLLMGFAAGSTAGVFEELGWTGFVVPKLRSRLGVYSTGAIVGFLWGVWHLPVNVLASGTPSGGISITTLLGTLLFSLGLLPAFRILMVLVWDHTGSLLIAMLMHMSLTASDIILGATATPGMMAIVFNFALVAAMWVVVAVSAVGGREQRPMHSLVSLFLYYRTHKKARS